MPAATDRKPTALAATVAHLRREFGAKYGAASTFLGPDTIDGLVRGLAFTYLASQDNPAAAAGRLLPTVEEAVAHVIESLTRC